MRSVVAHFYEKILISKNICVTFNPALVGFDYNATWWWGLFLAPLVSPELLGRFTKFKRRLIALKKLSNES